MRTKFAKHTLMDSVWTIIYQVRDDAKVRILHYSRNVIDGYIGDVSKDWPEGELLEDERRNVIGLRVGDDEYKVANSDFIFAYSVG